MPAILERLVSQLRAKGKSKDAAFAIATAALQRSGNLKKGTNKATAKGTRRGKMTPSQRAKDRASRKSKHKSSDYNYSSKTNRATLKD
jgi:hypothetical protein